MGFMKRFAFYLGLLLGMVTVAAAGTVALTYLLTGKFPALEFSGERAEVTLLTPDEVAALMRAQVDQSPTQPAETLGGEGDVGA